MTNLMRKSTATLLITGGLAIGAIAGTAEFTTTETGKKIIDGIETPTIKKIGLKVQNITQKTYFLARLLKRKPKKPLMTHPHKILLL